VLEGGLQIKPSHVGLCIPKGNSNIVDFPFDEVFDHEWEE
jgi:hypothetical protein